MLYKDFCFSRSDTHFIVCAFSSFNGFIDGTWTEDVIDSYSHNESHCLRAGTLRASNGSFGRTVFCSAFSSLNRLKGYMSVQLKTSFLVLRTDSYRIHVVSTEDVINSYSLLKTSWISIRFVCEQAHSELHTRARIVRKNRFLQTECFLTRRRLAFATSSCLQFSQRIERLHVGATKDVIDFYSLCLRAGAVWASNRPFWRDQAKRFLTFLDTMATGVLHEVCVCIASADMKDIGVKEP